MGKTVDPSNNNNEDSIKKLEQNKSDKKDKGSGPGTAIVLGLIGGIIALLLKNNMKPTSTQPVIKSRDPSLYRGMHGLKDEYDLIVVGAGLSGEWSQMVNVGVY